MKKLTLAFVILFAVAFINYQCSNPQTNNVPDKDSAAQKNKYAGFSSREEWGKHLTVIAGCSDCHTPKKMTAQGPVPDMDIYLSGNNAKMPVPALTANQLANGMGATLDETSWNGPWGTSFAANITSDATGIGNWTEAQFIKCITKGLYKGINGSRPLMPPMPWQDYAQMSTDELQAMFAFLKSTKAVDNVVPQYIPPAK